MDAVGFVGLEGLEVEAVVFLLVDLIVLIIVDGANVVVDAMVTCFVQDDASGDVVAGRVEGRVLEGVEEEDEEADLVDLVSRKLNAPLSKPPLGNCMKTNSVARVAHSARTDAQRHARLHLLVGIAGRRKEKRKNELSWNFVGWELAGFPPVPDHPPRFEYASLISSYHICVFSLGFHDFDPLLITPSLCLTSPK
jgi:hypothetical protein